MLKRKRVLGFGSAAVSVAAAAVLAPASAWAYFEMNVTGRMTTGNATCVTLTSGLQHAGANDPMTMRASAFTTGLTAASAPNSSGLLCNPLTNPAVGKMIRGSLSMSLIKRVPAGTGGRPDSYFHCRSEFPSGVDWSSKIEVSKTYSSAPCGAGHYAEIACIEQADSAVMILPFWASVGSFTTSNLRRDCNISPNWHPAGVSQSLTPVNI